MIIRTSLLYVLLVYIHIGALLAETRINVTVGSTAKLNCAFTNVQDQEPYIVWTFNDSKEVFERKGNSFITGEGYEDRVDVPVKNLRNGDCTLVLRNVSLNDKGEYESILNFRHTKRSATAETLIQRVTLVVEEAPVSDKEVPVPHNNDGEEHAERHESSNDAGTKRPHPLIILLSAVITAVSFLLQ